MAKLIFICNEGKALIYRNKEFKPFAGITRDGEIINRPNSRPPSKAELIQILHFSQVENRSFKGKKVFYLEGSEWIFDAEYNLSFLHFLVYLGATMVGGTVLLLALGAGIWTIAAILLALIDVSLPGLVLNTYLTPFLNTYFFRLTILVIPFITGCLLLLQGRVR